MKIQRISKLDDRGNTCSDLKQKRKQPIEIAMQKEQDQPHTFMAASAELQDIELPNFIEKCARLVKKDFASKNIAITISVRPDAQYCYADPRSLYHVLINLFNNAADALEGRERPEISIIAYKVGNDIRLRVKDNGCGMTEEQLHDLYKPFYTTKTHGSGIGLVIVNRLLATMNGTFKIESYSDIGTTVEITIPSGKKATFSLAARKAS